MARFVQSATILEVNTVAAERAARPVVFDRESEDQPYGCRDFDIRDPDGHIIDIGQNDMSDGCKLTLPYA